jgi:AmmeMemoRadiSam system protein B
MFNGEIDIPPSPIAGTWYSDRPVELQQEITGYLSRANLPAIEGKVIGLVASHAGYRYSGPTAAYAYRAVQGMQFDIVAIFSPFHAYTPEELLTTRHSAYQTPLGIILLNESYCVISNRNWQKRAFYCRTIPRRGTLS